MWNIIQEIQLKKKVLIIYYSQTGQLKEISNFLSQPFENQPEYTIDYYNIQPVKDYNFPWNGTDFYGVFPESFQQIPIAIQPPPEKIRNQNYDLIILAYQIWFLTPSIPVNSFLKSDFASILLEDKKVVTVIGCRNMWAKAQQKTKTLIEKAGGQLVGNVAFVDKSPNLISVITIVHWVMGGKKTKKWGIFPLPGVDQKDIEGATQFGTLLLDAMKKENFADLQPQIIAQGGVDIKPFIIFMDEKANKMFEIWSKFVLRAKKSRNFRLKLFKYYLLTALFIISPIVYIIFLLTYPLRLNQIKTKQKLYCGVK